MKKGKKGFTLVEIMIVVAIIGLLAAIGIPSFQKARANSRDRAVQNNIRMVESAAEQYGMENALDDAAIVTSAQWAPYIKGGTAALAVGSTPCNAPSVTLGTPVTAADMYTF